MTSKTNITTAVAILFHVCGLIGILFTPYKDWFIRSTPINICLMTALLIWTQPGRNRAFFDFFSTAFVAGMVTEIVGVHTAKLFGHYSYGTVLGPKLGSVPLLIGLNWFLVIFCSVSVMQALNEWYSKKITDSGKTVSATMTNLSLIADSALLAVFFDWVMEPVAIKLGFWQWQNNTIPVYNYVCWFVISLLLTALLRRSFKSPVNQFAVHLLIIQLLFFFTLRTFL